MQLGGYYQNSMVTREVLPPLEGPSVLSEFSSSSLTLINTHRIELENHGVFCLFYNLNPLKIQMKSKPGYSCEYLKPQESDLVWKGRSKDKNPLLLVPRIKKKLYL